MMMEEDLLGKCQRVKENKEGDTTIPQRYLFGQDGSLPLVAPNGNEVRCWHASSTNASNMSNTTCSVLIMGVQAGKAQFNPDIQISIGEYACAHSHVHSDKSVLDNKWHTHIFPIQIPSHDYLLC